MHEVQRLDPRTRRERFPAWSPNRYPDGYFNPARRMGRERQGRRAADGRDTVRGRHTSSRACGAHGCSKTDRERSVSHSLTDVSSTPTSCWCAAGAWTPTLLPDLDRVMWATGQPVVHFEVARPAEWQAPRFPVWAADIARTGWYGFPALADGTLKIGESRPRPTGASGRAAERDCLPR